MSDAILHAPRQMPRPEEIFDPVARGLDVIGDRWTLVLVRHLLGASRGFQELRKRTGIAPRVLSARLRQLAAAGFVESVAEGSRAVYALTEQGRSLGPIVGAIARWWIRHGLEDLDIDASRFTETSAQSVLESLPFMVDEEAARGVDLTFEIRLTGNGGGVWSVRVHDGECSVQPGFAERADVRYTADARVWCGVALGLVNARDAYAAGRLVKEGGQQAMDHYFHQVSRGRRARPRTPRATRQAARPVQRSNP
jgi:DNA-binding HxlR family transcriptional regulator